MKKRRKERKGRKEEKFGKSKLFLFQLDSFRVYLQRFCIILQIDLFIKYIVVLVIMFREQLENRCLIIDEWILKFWYLYILKFNLGVKK